MTNATDNIRNTLYLERDGQVCDPDDANQHLQCCPSELVSTPAMTKPNLFVDARLNGRLYWSSTNTLWQGATLAGAQLQNSTISECDYGGCQHANVSGSEFTTVDLGTDFTTRFDERRSEMIISIFRFGASMVNARIECTTGQ